MTLSVDLLHLVQMSNKQLDSRQGFSHRTMLAVGSVAFSDAVKRLQDTLDVD